MTNFRPIQIDHLSVRVYNDQAGLGSAAAQIATEIIVDSLNQNDQANLVLATGNSQLSFLKCFRKRDEIDWSRVNVMQMDEYIGIDPTHPASFSNFLFNEFIRYVDLRCFFPLSGKAISANRSCNAYSRLIETYPPDLTVLGIGENGHLAFNDPHCAIFNDNEKVKIVTLAEKSRSQQVGEGHFKTIDDVPSEAITLTIPTLLSSKRILAVVPEKRKAEAVNKCLTMPIDKCRPASVLRSTPKCLMFLDADSASHLSA